MPRPRGTLRQTILDALGDGRWHRAREIAQTSGFQPAHSLASYLRRLEAAGLAERGYAPGIRRPWFRLTGEGCRLRIQTMPKDHDQHPQAAPAGAS